jgi:type IV secretory pathway VirB2 component (pilin)
MGRIWNAVLYGGQGPIGRAVIVMLSVATGYMTAQGMPWWDWAPLAMAAGWMIPTYRRPEGR